jgi:hypothetical protein
MMFNWLSQFVLKEDKRVKLGYSDQFCITLIKLRLNITEQDLAYRFGVAKSTVSKYFVFLGTRFVYVLFTSLKYFFLFILKKLLSFCSVYLKRNITHPCM